jgi:hypothetical protein
MTSGRCTQRLPLFLWSIAQSRLERSPGNLHTHASLYFTVRRAWMNAEPGSMCVCYYYYTEDHKRITTDTGLPRLNTISEVQTPITYFLHYALAHTCDSNPPHYAPRRALPKWFPPFLLWQDTPLPSIFSRSR